MTDLPMPVDRAGAYRRPRATVGARAVRKGSADAMLLVAGAVAAGGVVLGMATDISVVTQVSAYAALAIGVLSPPAGLLMLCLLAPHKTPFGAVPPPQLNTFLLGATLLGLVFRLPIDRPRLRFGAPLLILLALYIYAFVQQTPDMLAGWSGERSYLVGTLFIQVTSALMLVVISLMVLRDRSPYLFLAALLASSVLASVLGLVTFEQSVSGPLANLLGKAQDTSRATGPFGDPNYYGLFLSLAGALSLALLLAARRRLLRLFLALVTVVIVAGMLVSLSRGAMLAFGASVMSMAFARSRRAGVMTVCFGAALMFVVYPMFVEWRLTNLTGSASAESVSLQGDSDEGRLTGVLAGVQLWLTEPVFGVGFGQYSYAVLETVSGFRVASHNWYMNLLGEQGLFGIVLWLTLTVLLFRGVLSVPRPARTVGVSVLTGLSVATLFAEVPMSFQAVALPIVVIAAVLVSDWAGPREPQPPPGASLRMPAGPCPERT